MIKWLMFLLVIMAAGCSQGPETEQSKLARWRKEYEDGQAEVIKAEVVGLTKIIGQDIFDSGTNIDLWETVVIVEHLNRLGGIERTNFLIRAEVKPTLGPDVHIRCVFSPLE